MGPSFYITRDVERAAGLLGEHTPPRQGVAPLSRGEFFVVTNRGPLADALKNIYSSQVIFAPEESGQLSTLDLMRNGFVQEEIRALSGEAPPNIIVFKTSPQIEKICTANHWSLLNPRHEIGAVLEEKIGQWKWLSALRRAQGDNIEFDLPQVWEGKTAERLYGDLISELGERPIVQFNRGHTGLGTFRLESESQWIELQKKFPNREVKVSRFYEGKAYTVNAVVTQCHPEPDERVAREMLRRAQHDKRVIVGNISEQLTGIPGCTNNPYATVGNDWSAGSMLSDSVKNKINAWADTVGAALGLRGYQGLFGIDVIVTEEKKVILIEVNPRQPASATMESQLQQERGEVSVMEQHLYALCHPERTLSHTEGGVEGSRTHVRPHSRGILRSAQNDSRLGGFQLFFRNTDTTPAILAQALTPCRNQLTESGLNYLSDAASVTETKPHEFFAFSVHANLPIPPGGEILRIQSKQGIVETLGPDYLNSIARLRTAMPH